MEEILYNDGNFIVTSTKVSFDDGETICQNILMEEIASSSIISKDIFPYGFMIILSIAGGIWNYWKDFIGTETYIIIALIICFVIWLLSHKTEWEHTLSVHSTGGQSISVVFRKCERENVKKIKDIIDNASSKRKIELSQK